MRKNAILIGIDPGFASFGWAKLCLAPPPSDAIRCDGLGVFQTEKASKKVHVLATEDHLRRARELATALDDLIVKAEDDRNTVLAFCAESMSWPRNAAVTAKMGITWGVVAAVALRRRIPIFQTSPQALKKTLTGRKDASKDEVEQGIRARGVHVVDPRTLLVLDLKTALDAWFTKGLREHPVDALAAAIVCASAEAVQVARRGMAA